VGQRQSGAGRNAARRRRHIGVPRQATIAELEDWELSGATWHPVELSKDRAVVELCTCYGEAVDVVESGDPEFIEFVRTHPVD
jgi:hypothetical protein